MRRLFNEQNEMLRHIVQKSMQLELLAQKIQKHLPQEVLMHCKVTNFSQGKLTLSTPISAVATNLRYMKMDLLEALRREEKLANLATIDIVVDAEQAKSFDQRKQSVNVTLPKTIHQTTYTQLCVDAEKIKDEELRNAMLKLAKRLLKPN